MARRVHGLLAGDDLRLVLGRHHFRIRGPGEHGRQPTSMVLVVMSQVDGRDLGWPDPKPGKSRLDARPAPCDAGIYERPAVYSFDREDVDHPRESKGVDPVHARCELLGARTTLICQHVRLYSRWARPRL